MLKTKIKYILISLIALFSTVLIVSASPTSTILRNIYPETTTTYDVGTSTTKWRNGVFQNMIVSSLGSAGNPCVSVDANGLMATSTCGGSADLYLPGFITATSSAFYNQGFITSTSTAFVTPTQLYATSFITPTSTANGSVLSATGNPTFNSLVITNTATSSNFIATSLASSTNQYSTHSTSSDYSATTLYFSDATKFTTAYMNTGFNVLNASTTNSTGASSTIQKNIYKAINIVQIDCSTDGSSITIDADERASSTPQTYGTGIFNNGSMICDSDGNSTSTFTNASMALNAILNFGIITVPNSSTSLRVGIKYQEQ